MARITKKISAAKGLGVLILSTYVSSTSIFAKTKKPTQTNPDISGFTCVGLLINESSDGSGQITLYLVIRRFRYSAKSRIIEYQS
jgi:hypothetical protein